MPAAAAAAHRMTSAPSPVFAAPAAGFCPGFTPGSFDVLPVSDGSSPLFPSGTSPVVFRISLTPVSRIFPASAFSICASHCPDTPSSVWYPSGMLPWIRISVMVSSDALYIFTVSLIGSPTLYSSRSVSIETTGSGAAVSAITVTLPSRAASSTADMPAVIFPFFLISTPPHIFYPPAQ